VNVKLHPSTIAGQEGCRNLAALVRTCFDLGGIQLQFNTVAREMLMDAMDRPEAYAGLVVRVSGFSALFTTLPREVQQDILARTEHRQL
jgi:formate C-acetyltransferase